MCPEQERKSRSVLVRFQVLTAACVKLAVFWDTAPCSLIDVYRYFRSAYYSNNGG
jgi:hypothetical protein